MGNGEWAGPDWMIRCGDCLDLLNGLESASVDAVVTDPPYGLAFMGKKWDYDVPIVAIWAECLRVLKPGGHLLAFAGTRTQHRMAVRIEDAGFEIRDMIAWVYGSGFPKSKNLDGDWKGWGTALKPAMEPITVARKPLEGTVAANVLEFGTGAINVDGCRVGTDVVGWSGSGAGSGAGTWNADTCGLRKQGDARPVSGRWPANLIHDGSEEAVAGFPEDGGESASRFFYCAKASGDDRDAGVAGVAGGMAGRADGSMGSVTMRKNVHPTVKPVELMRYLCRLVTPPGGVVLDPFTGSGSTGKAAGLEGFRFIGFEREPAYCEIAVQRLVEVAPLFRS